MDYTTLLNLGDPKQTALLIIIGLWELIWKGFALYRAGKRQEPWWFFFILIINSIGILPIIYLILTRKQNTKQSKKK